MMEVQTSQDIPLLSVEERARNAIRNIRSLVQSAQPWYDYVGKCEFNRGGATIRLKRTKKLRSVGDMSPKHQAVLIASGPQMLIECADVLEEMLEGTQGKLRPVRSHEGDRNPGGEV